MGYYFRKLLLLFLRSLIYIKRALFFCIRSLYRAWLSVLPCARRIVGIPLYTFFYRLKKSRLIGRLSSSGTSLTDWFGKRSVLQMILFGLAVLVMIPHSTLSTEDIGTIPGRETALYHIVGPGDEEVEETIIEIGLPAFSGVHDDVSLWRQDAVGIDEGAGRSQPPTDISGISAGGTALTKPTIVPGGALPSFEDEEDISRRSAIVFHEVQSGETVSGIADIYDITIETILWANNLTARSYIRPGDKLKILPASGVLHKVKSGETVAKIAKIYNAEQDDIIAFNNLQRGGSDIVVGEELLIPGGRKPAPPAPRFVPRPSPSFRSIVASPPSANTPAGSGYLWPTTVRYISQYFGWRHTGLDIAGPVGTPVYAAKGGTAIRAQTGWNGGYGTYVIIDHGDGVQTLYGHNSQLFVSIGENVAQGQTIAAMGSTGRSTGPHVHFEVRVGSRRMNPLKYIR